MSVTRRIAFGAAASWFSRGVTIVLGLVLMPVLFRHLPKEELGVWLLLGQSWAAMGILDLGFGVTLTRRIALAKGKSGADPSAPLTDETLREISDLVFAGRRIYRFMAVGVFLVSWALGFLYLRNLELQGLSHTTVWIAWTILCACQALTVWATVWTCLLQGVGYIGWDSLISSFISAGMLIAQIVVVLCGGGLVALATVAAVAVILQRAMTRWFAHRRRPELFALRGKWDRNLVRGMAGLAFRAWLTAVGTILVQNTDSFFIASRQGAQNIPAFRAAFVVLLNLHLIAGVFASSSVVFISQLWQAGQTLEIQKILQRNLRLGLSIMFCGSAAVLAAGESLFNVWLGPNNFIGIGILTIFAAIFILEQQTFIISTACRATEHEAFAGWMLGGGCLKLLLAYLLMERFGLIALAASTLLAQLLTAHWFVLFRGLNRLKFGLRRYLSSVLFPCLAGFGIAALLSFSTVAMTNSLPDWGKLLGAASAAGAVLLALLWLSVLDHHQRVRANAWMGLRLPFGSPAPK